MSNATVAEQMESVYKNINLSDFEKAELIENCWRGIASNMDRHELITIRQFCSVFRWPSESAMRAYIYRADELKISEAFVRVRRRVLISPTKFFSLIQKVESRPTQGDNYVSTTV